MALNPEANVIPAFVLTCDWQMRSIWYSMGRFTKEQMGGIIKSNRNNEIVDIKIVPQYLDVYKSYKKMANVMMVGEGEIDLYSKLLFQACEENINQYYHMPWINNLKDLRCYEYDLHPFQIKAFNTPADYTHTVTLFKKNKNHYNQFPRALQK